MSQHLDALALANEIRMERAAVKREIRAMPREQGIATVAEIVKANPDLWRTARLDQLLVAPHQTGQTRVANWLGRAEVSPRKKVGSLTERQRALIAAVLKGEDYTPYSEDNFYGAAA